MPNLHFYGMENRVILGIKDRIKEILKGDPVLDELVFTEHEGSKVTDIHEVGQPYMEISSTTKKDAEELAQKLDELDIDLEVSELLKYIPARSKRKK